MHQDKIKRTELIAAVTMAGRLNSTAAVHFHGAVAARFGLSASDTKTLDLLSRSEPLSAGEIGKHTGLTSASVTALIDRLEAKGMVRRIRGDQDRRQVKVELVPEGVAPLAALYERFGERMDALWARYDDDQLALILDFLTTATAGVRAALEELGEERPGTVSGE